jgi:hypothetical protein
MQFDQLPDEEIDRLYNAGLIPDEEMERIALERIAPEDLAVIEAIAYGVAKLLNTPIDQLAAEAGMEGHDMDPTNNTPVVGSWLAFLLGLPAGALGGYFLRRWQEDHPGQVVPGLPNLQLAAPPKASGIVGGPWLDIEPINYGYTIGGPWVDLTSSTVVGASYGSDPTERRHTWPQTKALIQSAINEVRDIDRQHGAAAYVWTLDPAGQPSAFSRATPEPTTSVISFNSVPEALDWMRDRINEPHVALALFDRHSSHWPNPTNWTKSNDPAYTDSIAVQAAKASPVRASGTYVGQAAVDDVKVRAQSLANKRAGQIVGVIHTTKDNLWHALAFHSIDDADDWFGTATHDPSSFTYAAYYDKDDAQWPHPVNEKTSGTREHTRRGTLGTRDVATIGRGVVTRQPSYDRYGNRRGTRTIVRYP